MPTSRLDLLRWQFDLTWSLTELHLDALRVDDFLWAPTDSYWTVRLYADGAWRPDWADIEPDPIPLPTIGWLSWHIGWWWSAAIDQLAGRAPRDRADVHWPGDGRAAVAWLRGLRDGWIRTLDGLTESGLDKPSSFPWPADAKLTVAHLVSWVNSELMKNVAEIGQLRLLRGASLA
ncbi:DinB family protein [Nocardia altamirensis]|uniref:DinB family protein n=1 Tax=Nocardia altamirensis TaxID=472158 RepID=UPI00083FF296|nr:DinB family protein [Nocardia altamirensis]